MAKHSILFISLLFIVSVVALTSAQSNSQNNCHSKKCIRNNRNKEFADINASNERFNKQSNLTGILTKYKQNLKEYKRLQVQSMRQKIKTLENTIKLQEQNFTRCKDSLMQKDMEISKKENDFVAELQSDIDQKELEISKLKKNISIIQSALDNQNNTFKNIIRMKDNDYAILHNSYVVLQNRIDYKDYEINMTRGQLQRKELMITELQKQIQLSNTEMNRMLSNNKTLSTQLENCTNEIFKLKADSSDIMDIIPEISVPVATTSSPIYVKVDSVFRPMDSDNCPPFGNYLGSHLVRLPGKQPFSIPCNSDSTNKVWSVIQRRLHQTLSFNRDWKAYREGFGDHKSEFFIGLEKIHLMTSSQPHELFIRLRSRQAVKTALYSHFEIAGEDEDYALISLGKYSGDAGDGMRGKVGQKFSTFDRDNDLLGDTNCAEDSEGAWWFSDCGVTNLNFKFYGKNSIAVLWNNFLDFSGVSIEMMIRAT